MTSPWWNVLTTVLGALAALCGSVLAQVMTNQREYRRDERRYKRDQEEKHADQVRQVLLAMAAHAHRTLAVVEQLADPQRSESTTESPDLVHPDLLTAQARVYAPEPLVRVWLKLTEAQVALDLMQREDDLPIDSFLATRYLPANHPTSVVIRLAGETVMRLISDQLNQHTSDDSANEGARHVATVVLEAIDLAWDSDADRKTAVRVVNDAFRLVAPQIGLVEMR